MKKTINGLCKIRSREQLKDSPKKKVITRKTGNYLKYRLATQVGFALLCVWIGIEFHYFVMYLQTGGIQGSTYRPPGVEGFLPIGSLMSLYYFILSGELHPAHPAGVFIFGAILAVSLIFGKSFCSWICPVGLLSESIGDFSEKILKKRLSIPRSLDYPLRGLKYLLLGFFVYVIFTMSAESLRTFLDSPYNQIADIKMYYFFAEISSLSLIVIGVLLILSFILPHFWCRYLCPYGALLGIFSLASPQKITRNPVSCIECGRCAKACPQRIKVDKAKTVISDECTTCMSCVDSCPVADTLFLRLAVTKREIPFRTVAIGLIVIYFAIVGIGAITGNWGNDIPIDRYLEHHRNLHLYDHPR